MKNGDEWQALTHCGTGRLHQEKGMRSQDQVVYAAKENRQVIVLTDGIGQTDRNAEAGEKIAGCVSRFLLEEFDDICIETDERIARALFIQVRKIIEAFMKQKQMPEKEFASTLLGICIDREKKIFCGVHLGDGLALCKRKQYEILSFPANGFQESQTFLTTSRGAWHRIKVFRGYLDEISEFALMSDGAYQLPLSMKALSDTVDRVKKKKMNFPKMADDQSVIVLFNRIE